MKNHHLAVVRLRSNPRSFSPKSITTQVVC